MPSTRRAPAQDGAHAHRELARRERLRHVVVGAELEPDDAVGLLAARRQQDHGQVGASADPAAELEAVGAGQHHVEHDEARLGRLDQRARVVAVAGLERRRSRRAAGSGRRRRERSARRRRRERSPCRLLWRPLRVVLRGPLLVDGAERDPAQRMTRRRVDARRGRGGRRAARARRTSARRGGGPCSRSGSSVSRSPSQSSRPETRKSKRERRGQRRVELLAGVEAALRRGLPAREPAEVVAVEPVELARRARDAAPVAEQRRPARAPRPRRSRTRSGCP